jgi:hypothetical protein
MATGRGRGGASRAGSNHPALAGASAAPPCPRRGLLSRTYVATFSNPAACFVSFVSLNQPRPLFGAEQRERSVSESCGADC